MKPNTPHPSSTALRCAQPSPAVARAFKVILATTAALWMGAAQAQVQPQASTTSPSTSSTTATRSSSGELPTDELKFRDFFRTPIGPTGLELSDTLRAAHQKTMRLVGYMVQQETPQPGRFMLTVRPVQMSEHADGEADDLPPATVVVRLDPAQQNLLVPHVRGLVEVQGVVTVGRFEERDGRVSWVRLQLLPDAIRGMNSFELAGYLHTLQHRH